MENLPGRGFGGTCCACVSFAWEIVRDSPMVDFVSQTMNCWFSHDVTKIRTKKLSILPRFYFHDALEQLETNFHTNFRFKRMLGFVTEYAWISELLRDAAFT